MSTSAPGGTDHDDGHFRIEVLAGDEQVILRLCGELDVTSTGTFTKAIDDLDATLRSVILDLGQLSFIDSTGVGAIVHARKDLSSRSVQVSILNPSERARFVFDLTGLSDFIITPG